MKKQAMHLKEEHKVMQENEIRNQIVKEEKLTEVAELLKSIIEQITIKIKSESNEMLQFCLHKQLIKKKQELLEYTEEIDRSKLYRLNIERERAVKELKSKQEEKMGNGITLEKHKKEGNAVETKEVNEKVKKENTNKEDKYSCEENLAQLKEENKILAQAVEAKSREADEARKTMEEMFEAKLKVKPAMVEFLERQVAALEEELECPVCLEVLTTSPIYKCADDHLICPGCRPRVARCPQCRETYPRGEFRRFRGAERQAERLVDLYRERQDVVQSRGISRNTQNNK